MISPSMLSEKDLAQIASLGASTDTIQQQLTNFQNGFPFMGIAKAGTIGDGILKLSDEQIADYVQQFDEKSKDHHWPDADGCEPSSRRRKRGSTAPRPLIGRRLEHAQPVQTGASLRGHPHCCAARHRCNIIARVPGTHKPTPQEHRACAEGYP